MALSMTRTPASSGAAILPFGQLIDQGRNAGGSFGGIVVFDAQLWRVTQTHPLGYFAANKAEAFAHPLKCYAFVCAEVANENLGVAHILRQFDIDDIDRL